jgi:hypothetical protein
MERDSRDRITRAWRFRGSPTCLLRDVWAVLAVAVGLDFLGTEEVDSDTGCLETGAGLPPEAVHGLSDTGLRAAKGSADELAVGRVEAFKLLGNGDAADVNSAAAAGFHCL